MFNSALEIRLESDVSRIGLELADFVDKVGIQTSWDSDAACLVDVWTVVRCILRAFSGSLGHMRPR
jgi:hypothetical protein